jgi:FAD/FMN-containing dehydrogenase
MSPARLKHFGWGREGEGLTAEEEAFVVARAEARFGTTLEESASAPRLEDIELAAPRVDAPASLTFCTSEHYDRVAHTYGKSYPELVRGLARDYASAPDVVAYPRDEADVAAVLDWAGSADATVTPFGGGSSVCGGVEPKRNGHKGAVTLDLRAMGKVKEVDKTSRAALIEGGTYGPALEAQLRPHGLTLRHFPQSFEYSTLGGWIATRGGGHFPGVWRNAFIRMPYAMERLILRNVINDTFETAITWERFEQFHEAIRAATENAILATTGRGGQVTCRFTHVYPDGPAPYFTIHALGEPGKLGAQWQAIKSAALDAVIANGGTVTHHHAVGRDHRPWYDRQRPPLFAEALRAAKKALDPQGLLNPGVLIDP